MVTDTSRSGDGSKGAMGVSLFPKLRPLSSQSPRNPEVGLSFCRQYPVYTGLSDWSINQQIPKSVSSGDIGVNKKSQNIYTNVVKGGIESL